MINVDELLDDVPVDDLIEERDYWQERAGVAEAMLRDLVNGIPTIDNAREHLAELARADAEARRTCRVCGCTDDVACVGGCTWTDADLCSRCGAGPDLRDPDNESAALR